MAATAAAKLGTPESGIVHLPGKQLRESPRGQALLFGIAALADFVAIDADVARRFDAKPYAALVGFQDRNDDAVANPDPLA